MVFGATDLIERRSEFHPLSAPPTSQISALSASFQRKQRHPHPPIPTGKQSVAKHDAMAVTKIPRRTSRTEGI
jgi:hypothetical protein